LKKYTDICKKKMQLAIFASGTGSNATKIFHHFENHPFIKIKLLISNNNNAAVINKFNDFGVETIVCDKDKINSKDFIDLLDFKGIEGIVLAGFLLKVPKSLINAYENRILNIHPSLLPKYGGKGMYGMNVHKAVFENGESESGITIHVVTENFDEGPVIFQARTDISDCKTPEEISDKVRVLEHQHFPIIVEKYFSSLGNQ
jgi:phosphoribosylglycinamide formyltransferase-1